MLRGIRFRDEALGQGSGLGPRIVKIMQSWRHL